MRSICHRDEVRDLEQISPHLNHIIRDQTASTEAEAMSYYASPYYRNSPKPTSSKKVKTIFRLEHHAKCLRPNILSFWELYPAFPQVTMVKINLFHQSQDNRSGTFHPNSRDYNSSVLETSNDNTIITEIRVTPKCQPQKYKQAIV